MKTIISIDGSKGGTGKSMVSCAVVDYALSLGKSVFLVDGDTANPDAYKTYEGAEGVTVASIKVDDKESFISLSSAIHKSKDDCVVINNPARSEGWREHGGFIADYQEKLDAKLITFWVANRQPDSLELLTDYHEALPSVPVVFVMNAYWGAPAKFEIWAGSDLRKTILKSGGEIVFPDIADRVAHAMRVKRMRWDQIESLDFGELIEAERCRKAFYTAFAPLFS